MSEKAEVIANLRAVLISQKGPTTLRQLGRDYKDLGGSVIPFKKFGFATLVDFLKSDPTFRLYNQHNETYISVAPKEESRHITEMIAKQKCSKKRSRSAIMPRALRDGMDRRSRVPLNPPMWNTKRPLNTSISAQLYAGKPSREITFSHNRTNGNHFGNNSSVQQRFMQAQQTPTLSLKTNENIAPTMKSVIVVPQKQPVQIPPTTKVQNSKEQKIKSVTVVPEKLPLQVTTKINRSAKELRSPHKPENLKTLDNLDTTQSTNMALPKHSSTRPDPPSKWSKMNQNRENSTCATDSSKRYVINLETVKMVNFSNAASLNKPLEYGNVQVTLSNDTVPNGNSVLATRPSMQDRLNRIRQQQITGTSTSIAEAVPPPLVTTKSQQSRLQKYKNVEPPLSTHALSHEAQDINVENVESDIDENTNYEKALIDYCIEKNLSIPQIQVKRHSIPQNTKFKSDRPAAIYGCTIKVGEECTYGSYSDGYTSQEQASQAAAKTTLEALIKSYGSLEERDLPITEGRLVPKRLLKLVAGHSNGKFLHQLPADYREEYRENVPDDWVEHVKKSHLFLIESSVGGSQIIFVSETPSFVDLMPKKDHEDFIELSPMILPELEGFWNVLITNVCSTVEIWGQIIGDKYSGVYEELVNRMQLELPSKKVLVQNPDVGGYYAVWVPECWVRVQILEIEQSKALCFYIDTGEEEWHQLSDIYKLDKKFRYVPPQGVLLQLAGLQEYAENKYAIKHLIDNLLNKALVAEVVQNESDDRVIPVVLYDTYTNEDINLNALLLKKIKDEVKAPRLKEKGRIGEVFVSHVSNDGDVFVQIRNDSFKYLLSQIQVIADVGFGHEQLNDCRFQSADKLYLAVNEEENKCSRVTVTGPSEHGKVPVFFVDYGYCGVKEVSKLYAIDKLSPAIDSFPHQALKVKLNGMPTFTAAIASRLRGSLPKNSSVLLKVVEPAEIPIVEIFMRTQNDLLISVNNALQNEMEIERNAVEVECRPLTEHMERMSFMPRASRNKPLPPSPESQKLTPKSLPSPKIPCDGSFFPVIVRMAASPANFVIQPYKVENELANLMKDLQSLCKNSPSSSPSHKEIEKGNLYAGKHSDGIWYRVQVTNVMSNNSVTVHFCDYGDYDVMSSNDLQKLTAPFLKIPYHALRARLTGISPQFGEWSVDDCLSFQKLVCDKAFISIINSIDLDELNPPDKILTITLIDTSSDTDIYINPEYIRKNIAKN